MSALDSAHLHLRPGTVHALLGENGAGKTTLMRIAYGMIMPDAGTIRIDTQPVRFRSPADAISRGIGMVQQHFSLVPAMQAVENFALGGKGRFVREREVRRLAHSTAELGLSMAPDAPASTMSPAEQQQLEIAKALGRDCRVLILDEPTAVLSPLHAAALLKWLRAYVDRGHSVILITHKLRDAIAVADDVTVLRHGRTVLESSMADTGEAALLAVILGISGSHSIAELPSTVSPVHKASQNTEVIGALHSVSAEDRPHREYLHDVSLEVKAGEIVGIAGLDGSGHRLLLRVLAHRYAPARGSVRVPPVIAFVPENRHAEAVAPSLDLRDNVALRGAGARRGWVHWQAWTRLTRQLLHEFDVRARNDRASVQTLSGGNQQKLVLARELAGAPRLIVAENPTRGLDVRATNEIRSRLRSARDMG
ncbi:MAG: ABC transporter ATP-binding protein, partial [Gemmatimonadaceae bacterium]